MSTVLIITVGTTYAPIVRSIADHSPDHVYFLCTVGGKDASCPLVDGPGTPCVGEGGIRQPSIVAQTGLTSDRFRKFPIENSEDLAHCLQVVTATYAVALADHPAATIIADYTGGTKTMSAALVRVATGQYAAHSRLSVVTGSRGGPRGLVIDGTEVARGQDASWLVLEEQWLAALHLANGFYYASAEALLNPIMQHYPMPPSALLQRTQILIAVCRGLDAWDRFDHAQADRHLRPHAARLDPSLLRDLTALVKHTQRAALPLTQRPREWDASAVLPVFDLLRNAECRAAQGRHDDAVARLYRVLEMLAQQRLWAAHGIDSANVDPALVPEWLATRPERAARSPIQIGLREDYQVLASHGDPVGLLFTEREKLLSTMLERRNRSILAHGTQPITAAEYPALQAPVASFIADAIAATGLRFRPPAQFPHLQPTAFA